MDPLRSHGSTFMAIPDHLPLDLGHSHGKAIELSEGVHRGGSLVAKPSWGMIQDPFPAIKKLKLNTNGAVSTSMDSFNSNINNSVIGLGNCHTSTVSNSGFSAGTRSSEGMVNSEDDDQEEGSMMDLGLCLTATSSQMTCSTSTVTEGKSNLTSTNSSILPNGKRTRAESGLEANIFIGLGPSNSQIKSSSKGLGTSQSLKDVARNNTLETDMEVQLQLGLSRSSTAVAEARGSVSSGFDFGGRNDANSVALIDEGSTSARNLKAGGYIPYLLMGRRIDEVPSSDMQMEKNQSSEYGNGSSNGDQLVLGLGKNDSDLLSKMEKPTNKLGNDKAPKTCQFKGCSKGARGVSGLCITHGGGRRCDKPGCNKGAEGSTVYCKSHGGGRRCQRLGCTKSAEGKTDFCIAHGGGRRCSHDGCIKAARGRSGLCIRHGGGKRCQREGCTKSAEGYTGLCIAHGGGRRCQYDGCTKGAQGSTMFCKAHGGGKRCMIQGCNKGAEGSTPLCKGHGGGKRCMFDGGGICTKSVHGGTPYCVAHGGGKRCVVEGCTKSARGRTDFCVKHGGGKRCKFENCTKSAQGSTDFCKAHGGGKRCQWGRESCPYREYVKDKTGDLFKGPCDRFARGKLGLCAAHVALVQDRRVHGVSTIGNALPAGIGPGLFRGLVVGSVQKGNGNHVESVLKRSSATASTMNGSQHNPSNLVTKSKTMASSHEDDSCSMSSMSQISIGYNPNPSTNCHSNKNDRENDSLNKRINYNIWPGLFPSTQTKADHSTLVITNNARNNSSLSDQFPNRPLLPPRVLVPPSMQKGNLPFSLFPNGTMSSNASKDNVYKMSSGFLPDERVHGGSIMSLLNSNNPNLFDP